MPAVERTVVADGWTCRRESHLLTSRMLRSSGWLGKLLLLQCPEAMSEIAWLLLLRKVLRAISTVSVRLPVILLLRILLAWPIVASRRS